MSSNSKTDDFASNQLKMFILRTLRTIDDEGSASVAVVETMVDIAQQYVSEVGRVSAGHQQLAGRAQGGFYDAQQAVYKLGGITVRNLIDTAQLGVQIHEHNQVIKFPAHTAQPLPVTLSIKEDEPEAPGQHIPAWFPSFPQKHTYIHSDALLEVQEPQEIVKRKRETCQRLVGYMEEMHKRSKAEKQDVVVNADASIDKEVHIMAPLPQYVVGSPYVKAVAPYDPQKDPRIMAELSIDQEFSDQHGRNIQSRNLGIVVSSAIPLESRDQEEYAGILKAERLINSDHTAGLATSEADI